MSGLKRVEYWLRPSDGKSKVLADDDPAWQIADWKPCQLDDPTSDWSAALPAGVSPKDILCFDKSTGRPTTWPLRYSMVTWSVALDRLEPGKYELRVRAVDLNDFAQPEPRPEQKTGRNAIQMRLVEAA